MVDAFGQTRRRTLGLLGSILTVACETMRGYPQPAIDTPFPPVASIPPVLKPRRIVRSPAKKPKYAIDAHAHFFNGSDVNVKDYVALCIAHSVASPELRKFVEELGDVAQTLVHFAPTADVEYLWLLQRADSMKLMSLEQAATKFDEEAARHRKALAEALASELNRRDLGQEYLRLQGVHRNQMMREFNVRPIKAVPQVFTPETVLDAIDPRVRLEVYPQYFGTKREPTVQSDPGGLLEFVGHMLSPRWLNLRTYQIFYSERADAFGIDAAFGSLVDFDYWLSPFSISARRDQMMVQALLSLMSGGYMLPLISYNPWTDLERSNESYALVREAIEQYGFIGVKLYPPVGYYPYGNAQLENPTKLPRPDHLEKLDAALKSFYVWCAQKGVPVMAHAGQSMGRDDPSDSFGGAEGWRTLLIELRRSKVPSLIINAGHFGGAANKGGPPPEKGWPAKFAELSRDFPEAKVYGDLGFWDELQDCSETDARCATGVKRLRAALNVSGEMARRIMYGSDWEMLSFKSGWHDYPSDLAANLERLLKGALPAEDLYFSNAMACFGLNRGDIQQTRIISRLAETKDGPPPWLQSAT